MKNLIILLITAALSNSVLAQGEKRPFLTRSFNASEIRHVKAYTTGGSLSVTGDATKEAKVEVFVTTNNDKGNSLSDEDIKARLNEYYNLNIEVSGNELRVVASAKNGINWRKSLSISFRISAPKEVSTDLNTRGGSIHLSALTGEQSFKTSGGSLHLDDLNGSISGRTSGGSIHLAGSKGIIDLKTSGGSIEALNCDGTIELSTSGGSLDLQQLKGKIQATTSGGSVKGNTISGDLLTHTSGGVIRLDRLSCSLDASTSGGSIDASFLEPGKSIKINAVAGSATIELPKNKGYNFDLSGSRVTTGVLNNFNGSIEKNKVRGSLNGGGSDVYVHTSVGSVTLEWK